MIFIINHYVLACYNEILKMLKNKSIFFNIFQEMTAENMSHLLVVSHRVMLLRTIAILRNNRKISNRQTSVDTNNKLVRPRQCPEVEGITLAKVIHQQLQVKINVKKYEFIPFLRNFCLYEKLVKSNKLFSRKKRIKLNVFLKKQTALCAELFR